MQSTWPSYLDSRSQVKVKGFILEFCVRSISPVPFDRFSWYFSHMFLLVRRCAEHMTQLPRLKVTGQGQMIYPWILCRLPISLTLEAIFIKLQTKYYSELDNVQNLWHSYTDSRSRSQFKVMWFTLELDFCSISPKLFELVSSCFIQMFLLVRQCAESMSQLQRLKVKVTVQGQRLYPWILCPLHISWTLWKTL